MPADFEPPVPAWGAGWNNGVQRLTTAIFGVQHSDESRLDRWAARAFAAEVRPARVERARYTDLAAVNNAVYLAYFTGDGYARWADQEETLPWWRGDGPLQAEGGYWREIFHVPIERMETLHSTPHAHGVAHLSDPVEGPVEEHAYPGAARDRIPASARDTLKGEAAVAGSVAGRRRDGGRRVRIEAPHNLCVIRSGQDWSHCEEEERRFYLDRVQPHLVTGMDYLARNPEESRCLCMRLMTAIDDAGDELEETFGLGYALDIHAFEEWARSHPTHAEIFGSFMSHAQNFGDQLQLRLWHEVSVVPGGESVFEYVDCHTQTGLLRHQ